MNDPCPLCGTRHRKFPRTCYYSVHGDYVHVVIAKLASYGTPQQKEWCKEATASWKTMESYVAKQGWNEHDGLKLKRSQ